MTVMSATFGALPGVQFMHAIFHFEAQEVKNPMLQTVHNSELKWRSYSHCKPITPSWRNNFAQRCEITLLCEMISQPFCTVLWNSSWSCPIYATSWKPCENSLLLRSDFAALFVRLRNLADLVFTCEMVLSASRYLRPTLWDIFLQIFLYEFPFFSL